MKKLTQGDQLILIHLSTLGSFIVPFLGLIASVATHFLSPHPLLRKHAKEVMNFNLTLTLLWVGVYILFISILGIPGSFFLGVYCFFAGLIFPILAAKKVSKGHFYRYPLTFRFF